MNYALIVTTRAEQHTIDACIYYEEQQPGLGERFLDELYISYKKIADHPQYYGFISSKDKYRDIRLHTFPYIVIYEINNNEVIVIDVFNIHKKHMY